MNDEFFDKNVSSSDSSSNSFDSFSDIGINEFEENEEVLSEGSNEVDYSSILSDLDTDVNTISGQIVVLNDNICVLNENVKVCTGLIFVLVVLIGIKFIYHILTSILGLGKM